MYKVMKYIGEPIESGLILEIEENFNDALLFALMYCEEHFDRICPDRGQLIGVMFNKDTNSVLNKIIGYRFITNNGSIISYRVNSLN